MNTPTNGLAPDLPATRAQTNTPANGLAPDLPASRAQAIWVYICQVDSIQPERGVAALVDNTQIAVVRTFDGQFFAVGNRDPLAGAQVMSRGIVGSRGDAPTLASPLHKQVYDLRTGECLDVPGVRLPTYPVRCEAGLVEVALST